MGAENDGNRDMISRRHGGTKNDEKRALKTTKHTKGSKRVEKSGGFHGAGSGAENDEKRALKTTNHAKGAKKREGLSQSRPSEIFQRNFTGQARGAKK
jgi:hypothetical protein